MKTLLVIPAYNEQDNIVALAEHISSARPDIDFIVINDGSTDQTGALCKNHNIPCIDLTFNLGIGGAVQTGYRYAQKHGYECAVQFDGDGQHDLASLEEVLRPIEAGECDLALGSRFLGEKSEYETSLMRRVGIGWINTLIRILTGATITDCTSGYRAASKPVIELFAHQYPTHYPEPESIVALLKKGYSVKEYPVNMFARTGGRSSIHSWKAIYYMVNVTLALLILGLTSQRRKDA